MNNWYNKTVAKDPLMRVSAANHFADHRHFLTNITNRAPKGDVNPKRVDVNDPKAMARHIKRVGQAPGGRIVGIARGPPGLHVRRRIATSRTARRTTTYETLDARELAQRFPSIVIITTSPGTTTRSRRTVTTSATRPTTSRR